MDKDPKLGIPEPLVQALFRIRRLLQTGRIADVNVIACFLLFLCLLLGGLLGKVQLVLEADGAPHAGHVVAERWHGARDCRPRQRLGRRGVDGSR